MDQDGRPPRYCLTLPPVITPRYSQIHIIDAMKHVTAFEGMGVVFGFQFHTILPLDDIVVEWMVGETKYENDTSYIVKKELGIKVYVRIDHLDMRMAGRVRSNVYVLKNNGAQILATLFSYCHVIKKQDITEHKIKYERARNRRRGISAVHLRNKDIKIVKKHKSCDNNPNRIRNISKSPLRNKGRQLNVVKKKNMDRRVRDGQGRYPQVKNKRAWKPVEPLVHKPSAAKGLRNLSSIPDRQMPERPRAIHEPRKKCETVLITEPGVSKPECRLVMHEVPLHAESPPKVDCLPHQYVSQPSFKLTL
uniref:Uncharacterized protein n=1 Tax=Heliothis virescens TaxID=7102 RepID=A0A2A4IWT4_HELVI